MRMASVERARNYHWPAGKVKFHVKHETKKRTRVVSAHLPKSYRAHPATCLRGDIATAQDKLNRLVPIIKMVATEQWDEIIAVQPATTTTETTESAGRRNPGATGIHSAVRIST